MTFSRRRRIPPPRPAPSAAVGALALVSCGLAGCAEDTRARPTPGASSTTGPTASAPSTTSAAPSASASAPSEPVSEAAGPCRGQPIGSHACDGRTLLACGADAATTVRECLDIEKCDEEKAVCAPGCPEEMVYIPATSPEGFVAGKNFMQGPDGPRKDFGKGHQSNTDIPHRVTLTRPFCMNKLETTVAEWKWCMKEHGCRRPDLAHRFVMWPDHDDHPINAVSFKDARYFCYLKGKTLPTEAQWEWAATGGDGRTYPWGDEPANCERADYVPGVLGHPAGDAGCRGGGPSPVGSHPKGDKVWPDGVIHDLAGNVWEWCLDNYEPYPMKAQTDPLPWRAEDLPHVVRGGGWNRSHQGIKAAFRGAAVVGYRVPGLGFRCVMNHDQKALNEKGWPAKNGKAPSSPKTP